MKTIVTVFLVLSSLGLANFVANHKSEYDSIYINSEPVYDSLFAMLTYGDTLRIEIQKKGDTLIKHYIDVKGGSDDLHDNSFTVQCSYNFMPNDTTLQGPYYSFAFDNHTVCYNKQVVLNLCDSMLAADSNASYYQRLRDKVNPPPPVKMPEGFFSIVYSSSCCYTPDPELIMGLHALFFNTKTQAKPLGLFVEDCNSLWPEYNYYMVERNRDIVPFAYNRKFYFDKSVY